MISGISSWAGSIVTAVMIVTILEMILPEGKNKKYIKTVLSVYLLFTIISPIIKAVSNEELDLESVLAMENIIHSNQSINSISIQTSSSIENIYETNLRKDVQSKLEQKGYLASNVTFHLELTDEQNYGKIYEISMKLEKKENTKKEITNTAINKIESIQIEIGNRQEEAKSIEQGKSISEKEKKEIKEYLSSTYDVEENAINLY